MALEEGMLCKTSSLGFLRRSWRVCAGQVLGKVFKAFSKVPENEAAPGGVSGSMWHG